jgi:hypothetical protein
MRRTAIPKVALMAPAVSAVRWTHYEAALGPLFSALEPAVADLPAP